MASNLERQRAFAARKIDAGFTRLTCWVPSTQYADALLALTQLGESEYYELGPLRDVSTGRFVGRNK